VPTILKSVSRKFSLFIFWFENIIALAFFLLFELLLSLAVYPLTFFNILYSVQGLFSNLFYLLTWTLIGPLVLLFLIVKDLYNLVDLMKMHEGSKAYRGDAPDPDDDDDDGNSDDKKSAKDRELAVYNQIRETVIKHYMDVKRKTIY